MMVEGGTHIGSSAVAVVGKSLAEHADSSRAIAFVRYGLVVRGILAGAESFVDSRLDLVFGQRVALRLFDCRCQRSVVFRVGIATLFRGNGDVARKLREQGGTLRVLRRLTMFRSRPL